MVRSNKVTVKLPEHSRSEFVSYSAFFFDLAHLLFESLFVYSFSPVTVTVPEGNKGLDRDDLHAELNVGIQFQKSVVAIGEQSG